MLISIITPSFNQGKYLRRCLESVKKPDGVDIEHIILDNNSTDETGDILKYFGELKDGITRRIFIKKDDGQTSAINEGFSLAKGDVLCWLNTDEYYEYNSLECIAMQALSNPEIDIFYGDCRFVDNEEREVKFRRGFNFRPGMLLYYGCFISSCTAFYRRNIIESGELLDPKYKVAMDYEYYVRLWNKGHKFLYIPKLLASFTWHDNNISTKYSDLGYTEFKAVQDMYSSVGKMGIFKPVAYRYLLLYWKTWRVSARLISRYM